MRRNCNVFSGAGRDQSGGEFGAGLGHIKTWSYGAPGPMPERDGCSVGGWERIRGMRLHLLQGDLDFHWLRPADDVLWEWRGGTPVIGPWVVPRLALYADDPATDDFLPVDCLPMNTGCDGPILSSYARKVLEDLLGSAGEFWPVKVLDHDYWWFNCLASQDALDLEGTDAEWAVVDGAWGSFRWITMPRRLSFRPELVATGPAMFRVSEFPHGALFVRDVIEQAIVRHGLTGFKLDLVWSSEEGGVKDPAGFGFDGLFGGESFSKVAQKRAAARATLRERRA